MVDMTHEEPLVIDTGPAPTAVVIWLHGLGADGHDFAPIVPELGLPATDPVRFVFPHAPRRPVTINMGYVMRAWYDIAAITAEATEDADGIRASATAINRMIDAERERGIDSGRIILAGFSQGGAMALHCGLRYPHALAGVLALSCYLPLADSLVSELADANRRVPVLMVHGRQDPVVPWVLAQDSAKTLADAGVDVQFAGYDMAHTVVAEELQRIGGFLRRCLATRASGESGPAG